jgi:hypothetical protein
MPIILSLGAEPVWMLPASRSATNVHPRNPLLMIAILLSFEIDSQAREKRSGHEVARDFLASLIPNLPPVIDGQTYITSKKASQPERCPSAGLA